MTFCDICQQPIPLALTSDNICATCWREHAATDLAADSLLQAWALGHADSARGQLLLVAEAA